MPLGETDSVTGQDVASLDEYVCKFPYRTKTLYLNTNEKNDFCPEIIFTINFSELNIAERDNATD